MQDTILIVDDEVTVRQTVREWLTQANLDCDILDASDAESALKIANKHPIDLAILDWNLGAGDDGLQLLQDLAAFHPEIVAIMITGFANQATPLDAMRTGVRDYLDKNHDFNRDTLTKAVEFLEDHGYTVEVTCVNIARTRGLTEYKMFDAHNPVYIIAAWKGED